MNSDKTSEKSELLYADETYAINGAAMEVHSRLGCGFLESVYQEALEIELSSQGIQYVSQPELTIKYKGASLKHKFRPDLIVFGFVIVELKAMDDIGPIEEAQLLNYLKATDKPIGLILNFGTRRLQWKRLLAPQKLPSLNSK